MGFDHYLSLYSTDYTWTYWYVYSHIIYTHIYVFVCIEILLKYVDIFQFFILHLLTIWLQIGDELACLKTLDSNLASFLSFSFFFFLTYLTFDLVHKFNFSAVKDHKSTFSGGFICQPSWNHIEIAVLGSFS